jgi:arylsulfatase A-like enzyme
MASRNLMSQVDLGMSALIRDLHDRGLLDSTLIIWMGEFGRSPQVGRTGGRDHFARAWSTALFGGGIRAGQVIGSTNSTGSEVTERPISVKDFMATVCQILGIRSDKEIDTPSGRPIRIVEKEAQVIKELVA